MFKFLSNAFLVCYSPFSIAVWKWNASIKSRDKEKLTSNLLYILYVYIYIYVNLSRINKTTMKLLLQVSCFFHNLQVNVLLTKIFIDFLLQKALLIIYKYLGMEEFSSNITIIGTSIVIKDIPNRFILLTSST